MTPTPIPQQTGWTLLFLAWLVATLSTLGALFIGEVMGHAPCILCWYQRICMFPLVLVLAAGLFPFDRRVVRYALPLAAVGLLIALFHWGVTAGLIPERVTPCSVGVPCSVDVIKLFGFVTLPLLSVLSFSTIVGLLVLTHFNKGAQ
ncbi:MAG: disulfide bond formation protein B [Thiobacillus sp.]|nr:disulfide bond formation protein B [Thiobacillus sp.]